LNNGDQMVAKNWLVTSGLCSAIERKLIAGQTLFSQGQQSACLYEVVSGKIRLACVDPAGREVVLGFASGGDTIGEASLFSPIYRCSAVATAPAVIRIYQKAALLAEFARNPKAAQAFMARLSRRIIDLRARLERQGIHSARDRVRHYLATYASMHQRTVVLPGTLKDLAAELGLTHEALYRTLSEMESDGEIARLKGQIRLEGSPV